MTSIIITTFNYGRYIERAIRSCLDQSMSKHKYEIIVVDDASTDNTQQILSNYKEEIRIITFTENKGLAAARNEGVRKARGQYVLFIDADDYIHHDLLKIQSLYLEENHELDAVSVDYFLVDEKENNREWVKSEEKPIACGIMFRKDLLVDIGLYDEQFRAREEEDLRIRFLQKFSIYPIPLPLYRYRRHDKNLTNNLDAMQNAANQLKNKHS
jgi:glycosyltransferase involved in cell wall biosynthesis